MIEHLPSMHDALGLRKKIVNFFSEEKGHKIYFLNCRELEGKNVPQVRNESWGGAQ